MPPWCSPSRTRPTGPTTACGRSQGTYPQHRSSSNNTNAAPDPNNGTLGWHLGTNYDLSQITLVSAPSNSNVQFYIYDGATFNQGIAKISDLEVYTEFNYQNYLGTFLYSMYPVWSIAGTGEFLVDNEGFIYDLSQVSGFSPTLTMTGNAYVNQLINLGTNQQDGITVNLFDASFADSEFARGTAGNVGFYAYTPLSEVLPSTIYRIHRQLQCRLPLPSRNNHAICEWQLAEPRPERPDPGRNDVLQR